MRCFVSGLALAVVVLIAGCASGPSAPPPDPAAKAEPAQEAYAKTFPTSADSATVYLYRANYVGKLFPLTVSANDVKLGTLPGYSFFALEMPAGTYTLKTRADKDAELKIQVQAGRNYYVWLESTFGMLMGNPAFKLMQDKEAQAVIVNECSMVTSSAFRNVGR